MREALAIPVVANGEIWTVDDARRCREVSGCDALMLGRGMVADPGLALAVRGAQGVGWPVVAPLVGLYWGLLCAHVEPRHRAGRLKQWLNLLRRRFAEAEAAYQAVRTVNDPAAIGRWLAGTAPDAPEPRETTAGVLFE